MDIPVSMKTGFGLQNDSSIPTELLSKINAILYTFIDKSVHLGVLYSKSSGRNNLSSTDMLYAIQYQTREFLNIQPEEFSANENIVSEFHDESESDEFDSDEFDSDNFESDESDSDSDNVDQSDLDESDDELMDSNDPDDPTSLEYFCRSTEDNPLISKINDCHDSWAQWDPDDVIQKILKRAVDENFNSLLQKQF